jgi:sec-independent protein translocase protein TatA
MSLFDQPWHIIILLIVVLLLFGSSRLPGAAKALGQSMNIFKKSMREGMNDDQTPNASGYDDSGYASQATVMPSQQASPAGPVGPVSQPAQQWSSQPQQLTAQSSSAQQAQIDDLQRQIAELQRLSAAGNSAAGPVSDTPPSAQPS